MPFLASEGCFWPLTAFMRSEVKNDHAHVTTQRILNKFIEVNLSVGSMVWPWCCLFQHSTTMSLINKINWQLGTCTINVFFLSFRHQCSKLENTFLLKNIRRKLSHVLWNYLAPVIEMLDSNFWHKLNILLNISVVK